MLILTVLALISACTSFKEEDAPSGLSLDRSDISLSSFEEESFSVTVRSGDIWSVENKPEWIRVTSIEHTNSSLYEWGVSLSASANTEYDREGVITFKSGGALGTLNVIQRGEKGTYVAIESISISPSELTITVGETVLLSYEIKPSNASSMSVVWASSKPSVATIEETGLVKAVAIGTTIVTVATKDGKKSNECVVTVLEGQECGHPWVDLGLSSGLKWATYNIGASSPEEYGNYYAWGETSPKSEYLETNLKYCTHVPEGDYYTKYNTVDNKIRLEMTDDVPHMNWGGNWRMPTERDFMELREECRWEWISKNGIKGYEVIGTNGNSIFLPAAGHFMGSSVSGNQTEGHYWSSSIYIQHVRFAFTADCFSTVLGTSYVNRFVGQTVRAVTDSGNRIAVSNIGLDKTSISIKEGETAVIIATINPLNATWPEVIWTSDNRNIATVSPYGEIKAIAVGEATITATTYDGGKIATCSVSVTTNRKYIQFADANVKQYLLSYYDADHDNEISYEEAAAVTSIVSLNSVKAITSFDEFQYFTGVQSVPDNWLKGCQSLKSVVFPTSIRTVGTSAFEDCKSLSSVNLNKDIYVEAGAFKGTSLSGIINVEAFEGDAFSGTTVSMIYEHSSRLSDFYEFDNCLLSIPTSCTICLKTSIYSALKSRINELSSGISIDLADMSAYFSEKIAALIKSLNDIEQAIQSMSNTFDYSQIDEVRQALLQVQEYYMMIQQEMDVRFYEAGTKIDNCAYYFYAAINFKTDLADLKYSMEGTCSSLSYRISACNNALKELENKANATAPHSAPVKTRASSGSSSYSIDEIVSLFNNHVTSFDE